MEEIHLKKEPSVKLIIESGAFELKNHPNQITIGKYEFIKIDSLRLDKRVKWLVTFFSFLVESIFGDGMAIHKERDQRKFNYNGP